MMDITNGHITPEIFDYIFDQASPGNWKDVEALAKKSGLTARDFACDTEMGSLCASLVLQTRQRCSGRAGNSQHMGTEPRSFNMVS